MVSNAAAAKTFGSGFGSLESDVGVACVFMRRCVFVCVCLVSFFNRTKGFCMSIQTGIITIKAMIFLFVVVCKKNGRRAVLLSEKKSNG